MHETMAAPAATTRKKWGVQTGPRGQRVTVLNGAETEGDVLLPPGTVLGSRHGEVLCAVGCETEEVQVHEGLTERRPVAGSGWFSVRFDDGQVAHVRGRALLVVDESAPLSAAHHKKGG